MIVTFLETFEFWISVNCSAFLYCAVFFVFFFLSIDLLVCLFFPSYSALLYVHTLVLMKLRERLK